MVDAKAKSAIARAQWDRREFQELSLKRAMDNGDSTTEYNIFVDYINWELAQDRRHHHTSFELICAIYERALLRFPCDVNFWNDYILFIIEEKLLEESRAESRRSQAHRRSQRTPKSMAPTIDRATRHCPWSGTLWSQYILSAERECNNFEFISYIKHKATGTGILEAAGIVELAKVWTTYCSYLHRRAFEADSTDEHHGMAEVGIRSALEDLRAIYEKDKSNVAANEALFRLERMYIQYLSDTGSYDTARERFKMLASSQGHKYEFWISYYFWELQCWAKFSPSDGTSTQRRTDPPGYATAVLKLALNHAGRDLDWPQRIISVYLAHCEDYESADEMQIAIIVVKKALRELDKRRQTRRLNVTNPNEATRHQDSHPTVSPLERFKLEESADNYAISKRKRETEDSMAALAAKRARATPEVESAQMIPQLPPKRDRENASVIARGLPPDVAAGRVKQFFRDCGRIKSMKILPQDVPPGNDGSPSCIAVIEFETYEDALSAITRDQKPLNGYVVTVQPYVGATLYVTNFPPEMADDKSMRELFSPYGDIIEIRFPSLRYNPHRRFCYVQFASAEAAHQAVTGAHGTKMTSLDGKVLDLYVQISDPSRKHERSDASREGREIHVSNLIYSAEEADLYRIFERCGAIESARVPKKVDGSGKGFGFVLFEAPEAAQTALTMEDTEFRGRKLHIRLSTQGGPKHSTTAILHTKKGEKGAEDLLKDDIPPAARTIALMNVPDTVNDSRIRRLAEEYGPLVKLSLRPDHAGAILEFANENDAGKCGLGLDGINIDGQNIRVGNVKDMLSQNPIVREAPGVKVESQGGPKSTLLSIPSAPIRRPQRPGGGTGRRGGLGLKRFAVGSAQAETNEMQPSTKSNRDFKKLLEQSRSSQQKR
ncbi:Nucleotide-binding, alpha-beta plait [Ascosphaera apis ARSEF 7405]|uniref:Nucleotide-binding, alpha-beta plait n=1 Tax=Ascosphaera apis ARSEF 7405 TaxID=392613 RepID=A0A167V1H7_9EURO|nr:Nucleotide-binding, alpha-beta plait [Ascosphaera apis ARSEF 7405]